MICLNKLCFLLMAVIFIQCLFLQKVFAYTSDYPAWMSQKDYELLHNRVPITSPQDNSINWNFTKFTPREDQTIQNNHSNDYSGSSHFIYSSSPNPRYCIPGSSYSICH